MKLAILSLLPVIYCTIQPTLKFDAKLKKANLDVSATFKTHEELAKFISDVKAAQIPNASLRHFQESYNESQVDGKYEGSAKLHLVVEFGEKATLEECKQALLKLGDDFKVADVKKIVEDVNK